MEKTANELKVGDVIIAMAGRPYLTLIDDAGKIVEHDTNFDAQSATYTVEQS